MKSHEEVFKNVIRRRDNGEKIVKAIGNRWQPWVGLAACVTLAVIVSYIAFTSVEPVKDLKAEPESDAVNDSVSYMFNWDDVMWGKSGEGYDEVIMEWGYAQQDNGLKTNMALFEVLSSCPGEAIVAMGVSYAPHSSQIVDETDELIKNLSTSGYAVEKNGTVFFFASPNQLKELNFDGVEDCYFFLATKEQFYR